VTQSSEKGQITRKKRNKEISGTIMTVRGNKNNNTENEINVVKSRTEYKTLVRNKKLNHNTMYSGNQNIRKISL
jgi:hypothetical protein